jgi:hypothetical protein
MTVRAATMRRSSCTRWCRTCVAWCALIALAWPSLGPLPYVVHDFGAHVVEAGEHAPHAGHRDAGHHVDASSIPGSPTHPDDHDCPECEILKHLARCVLAVPTIIVAAPVLVAVTTRRIAFPRLIAPIPAYVPPARAPPPAIA